VKKHKLIVKNGKCVAQLTPHISPHETSISRPHTLNTNDQPLTTILEIDQRRPDRIIFMGENVEVTAKEFSLIYLLARHNEQVMSYEELLKELWKDEEDAIYRRVNYHVSNIRKKNILVVVPGRGIMLNLKDEELTINRQPACISAS